MALLTYRDSVARVFRYFHESPSSEPPINPLAPFSIFKFTKTFATQGALLVLLTPAANLPQAYLKWR